MMLYLSSDLKSRVFHLRKDCPKGDRLTKLSPESVRRLRACGMKRICLKCRKAVRMAR